MMTRTEARQIIDMVTSHIDTYPGETAEVRKSYYYTQAVDTLSTLHQMGARAFHMALGSLGPHPTIEVA